MSEDFKNLVDTSFDNGTPFWLYTKDYVYGMIPTDGDKWKEVSYTYEDPDEPLVVRERNADLSFQFMFEELEKGISFYIEDLNVLDLKDFRNSLEGKSGSDKIKTLIDELINNSSNYSSNLPIVKSKDDLGILKEKV